MIASLLRLWNAIWRRPRARQVQQELDGKPEFGEPWAKGDHGFVLFSKSLLPLHNVPVCQCFGPDNDKLQSRIIACAAFLSGIPTHEPERLIALRADEQLRRDIRGAYRASRWVDSAEST